MDVPVASTTPTPTPLSTSPLPETDQAVPAETPVPVMYHGFDQFSPMELKRDFIRADYKRSIRRRRNRSMYILYHRLMSRRGARDLVPADFKPKTSPKYKITPDEFLT
ncbi:hypothetical protein F2Q69_00046778 [Brassica cretica]|uniref:Uncharacterized protein n=1 Tax=Brassica cretica TaxID=69181 RepID=A0A8S9PW75_BRACR|nr:hypothetical protein F2Q69_00046778 [Brassica cretica]